MRAADLLIGLAWFCSVVALLCFLSIGLGAA